MSLIVFAIKVVVLWALFVLTATGCGDAAEPQGDDLDRAGADVRLAIGVKRISHPEDDPTLVETVLRLDQYPRVDCSQEETSRGLTCLTSSTRCRGGAHPTVCFDAKAVARVCYRADSGQGGGYCYSSSKDRAGERGGPLTAYGCGVSWLWLWRGPGPACE